MNRAISRVPQSLLSLGGGLFMCLFVSWKLSVLAFTSIFPVIVVTRVRAEWAAKSNLFTYRSQSLNTVVQRGEW